MIVGIAGTAKNTGKTTTLSALLREAVASGLRVGVTGIGYDGEERDTVTMLPKPRLRLEPGMLVTTSEECLRVSTAVMEEIERTGIRTALGEVIILRVTGPGLVVVAGPNKTDELRAVTVRMQELGAGVLFVDGSLNRIAPMVLADRLVFATGPSRSTDIDALLKEMEAIVRLFSFPLSAQRDPSRGIRLTGGDVHVHCAASPVHGPEEIAQALRRTPPGFSGILIPGMVTLDGVKRLVAGMAQSGSGAMEVTFDDPLKLLLVAEPARTVSALEPLLVRGVTLTYRNAPRLAAITLNPSYPAFDGSVYTHALLDSPTLLARFRSALPIPVEDIMMPGSAARLGTSVLAPQP